ncbi:MAG: hypothetical protein R3F43_33175, partial [bacterium]
MLTVTSGPCEVVDPRQDVEPALRCREGVPVLQVCFAEGDACTCECGPGAEPGLCPDGHAGTCEMPLPIGGEGTQGSTVGAADLHQGSCGALSGGDSVHQWRAAATGPVCVSTAGSAIDTLLYVRTTCADERSELACNDDDGDALSSAVTLDAVAGTDYWVIVDGYDGAEGPYLIHVTPGACRANPGDLLCERAPQTMRAAVRGPGGGQPFALGCAPDQVLVGIRGLARGSLGGVAGLCRQVVVAEAQVQLVGPVQPTAEAGGGAATDAICPEGQAVVGLSGRAGALVDAITVRCAPLRFVEGALTRGAPVADGPTTAGGDGGGMP